MEPLKNVALQCFGESFFVNSNTVPVILHVCTIHWSVLSVSCCQHHEPNNPSEFPPWLDDAQHAIIKEQKFAQCIHFCDWKWCTHHSKLMVNCPTTKYDQLVAWSRIRCGHSLTRYLMQLLEVQTGNQSLGTAKQKKARLMSSVLYKNAA